MRYSLVLSALVAATLATPYVNVEVTDGTDVSEEMSRGRHHGAARRHHGGRRMESDEEENQGFFSSLWNRNRRNRNRSRHRHHRNYDPMNVIDDLFGTNYECIIDGRTARDERRDARECCLDNGGELTERRGHCIFRDVLRSPREDWRNCAMEQRGAEFAECYYREQREIDDELEYERRRRHHGRHGRSGREGSRNGEDDWDSDDMDREDGRRGRRNGRKHRNDRDRDYDDQVIFAEESSIGNGNGRRDRERYECNIDLNDDNRRQQIMEHCCEEEADGRLDQNNQKCLVRGRQDTMEFEQCAMREGAQNAQCQRE